MATIQNDRDVLLQAESPRWVNPTTYAVLVTSDTSVFHVATGGGATPTIANLTANMIGVPGTVTWSATGATVTPSGNSATVAYSSLTGSSATVQAQITYNSQTYTATTTLSKVVDGTNGARTAVLNMYQWGISAPSAPAGNSTYTWATGTYTAASTPGSWTLTPGAAVAGQNLYCAEITYSDALTTTSSTITWSSPSVFQISSAGVNGSRTAVLSMYQWAASAPAAPSGTSTYTWATATYTAASSPGSWSLAPSASVAGQTLWCAEVSYADQLTTATSTVSWTSPSVFAAGGAGANGSPGTPGGNGARGTVNIALSGYSAWNATAAAAGIVSATGSNPMVNDVVTMYDATHSFTYFCTAAGYPGTWTIATQYLNGNLFVTGTICCSAINATTGSIGAVTFASGTTTFSGDIVTTGKISASGSFAASGNYVSIFGDGSASNTMGVFGKTTTSTAVVGQATGNYGIGMYGSCAATGGEGTRGWGTLYGVHGQTATGAGVFGEASGTGYGVYGQSSGTGYGVYGYAPSGGYAGYFSGNLAVTGTTTLASSLNGIPLMTSGVISAVTIGSGLTLSSGTLTASGGGGGISSIGIASSNGFAGSSSGGTTPTLTISTSVSGLLKGNGTSASAASAGSDYVAPGGALGTPSSGNLANCSFPTLNQNTSGSAGSCTGNAATATTATSQSGGTISATTGSMSSSGSTNILVITNGYSGGAGVNSSSSGAGGAGVFGSNNNSGDGVYGYNSSSGNGIHGYAVSGYSGYFTGGAGVYIAGNLQVTGTLTATVSYAASAGSGWPTNLSSYTNGPGYITSSGSCSYATSAGSAPAAGGTASNISGTLAVSQGGTGATSTTGSGANVLAASPTFSGTVAFAGAATIDSSGRFATNSSAGYCVAATTLGAGPGIFANSTSSGAALYASNSGGGLCIQCTGNGTYGGTWTYSSDIRLKKQIKPLTSGLAEVMALNPVTFKYKKAKDSQFQQCTQIGFVADDILVALAGKSYLGNIIVPLPKMYGLKNVLTIQDNRLIPLLVCAIKELKAEIDLLKEGQ